MTIVLLQNRGLFVSSPLRTGLTADFWDLWCYLNDWTWIVYIFYSSGFVWMVDFTNSAPFKGVCLSVSLIDLAIPPPFKEVFLSVCWIDLPIAPPFNGVYLSVCCPLSGHCHLKLALSICSWRRNVWKKLSGVYSHPYFFHLPWRVPISSCECISHLGPDAVANRCSYHGSDVSRC